MSLIEKISDQASLLTPSERKLVETVIESPKRAALGTANELAQSVGVHEATASRLAKKLGYDSYATFREALREEFIATNRALLLKSSSPSSIPRCFNTRATATT